jgi:hypothetical protein
MDTELKDMSGTTLFTTSTRIMAKSRETTGSFVNGQQAFTAIKKDIGGQPRPSLPCPCRCKLTVSGRTGIEVTFMDPLNGHSVLAVGSQRNFKSEATVEDQRGVMAVIKWDDMGMSLGGGKKSGDGSGTDVSTVS